MAVSSTEEARFEALLEQMPVWTHAQMRCTHCGQAQVSVHPHYLPAVECSACGRMEARAV